MKTLHDRVRNVLSTLVLIQIASCAPSPPWPERADLVQYDAIAQLNTIKTDSQIAVSPIGARVTEGGLYIDLLFQSGALTEKQLHWSASRWSERISWSDDGNRYFEVTNSLGEQISLHPWRYHKPFFLPLTRTYEPAAPAGRIVESTDRIHRVVQTFVFRTVSKIPDGSYWIQLTDAWGFNKQELYVSHERTEVNVR